MVCLSANFLWGGTSHFSKMHLVKMDTISRPKRSGGWGLLHMRFFGKAFLCNFLKRGIFGTGKWSSIINQKYLKGKPLVYWYRKKSLGSTGDLLYGLAIERYRSCFLISLDGALTQAPLYLLAWNLLFSDWKILSLLTSFPPCTHGVYSHGTS